MPKAKHISLPIFSTGEKMKVGINKILYKKKSDFQDILIIDSAEFGRCLIIDGVMQCAESDHDLYDCELLKMLQKKDRKILILGGGDGYVAEMALKINPNLSVRIVDLDIEVVKNCKNNLDQKIFNDKRVKLYVEDVFHYLEVTLPKINGKFDGIVCDLTDAPIGRRNKKDFEKFYSDIMSLSQKHLNSDGWMSVQAGASKTSVRHINAVEILSGIMEKYFCRVKRTDIEIPSYGESCAFLFGSNKDF